MAKFRARARTIDMLGRQQIANVSTAISELLKNAHDAYADNAEVDYFRSDGLLVVRDNGTGMTPEEFESRWLTLGTESKYSTSGTKADVYRPPGKSERAIMGEKGIGRLAIGLLGPQVLLLTRAKRKEHIYSLVMAFIHWGLFEVSGLNLDEIELPIHLIEDGRLPTEKEVKDLVEELKSNVKTIAEDHPGTTNIISDLDRVQLDPINIDEFLGGLTLRGGRTGTHFYVVPANEEIAYEIENEQQKDTKEFSKFLLGFSNSVFRELAPPPIQTAFRYWRTDEAAEDLIADQAFFTREELESADHRISGSVDEFGQFKGDIRIYEEESHDHVIPWVGGLGKPTRCGPFEIEFGYIQGKQRESRLPPDEWKKITDKLNRIGGIYVYRDRIRILPYGNSDVDWLDIEQRRSKHASYYVFAHRRMFGAVKLTRKDNGLLREKAGREGFQQDRAYREFKSILENIFIQLAADFFRESGDLAEYFNVRRAELEQLERARQRREKQVSTKRRNLASSLASFFQRITDGLPQAELASLRNSIQHQMKAAAAMDDADAASTALLNAEKKAHERLAAIRDSYRMKRPRGVGLSASLQRDWEGYRVESERLKAELFDPFSREVAQTLGAVAKEAKLYVDQRRRLSDLIKQQAEAEKRAVSNEATELKNSANDTRNAALRCARDAIKELQDTVSHVEAEFARKDLAGLEEDEIEALRSSFEAQIESVGHKNAETLGKVRDMLTAISSSLTNSDEIMHLDMVEAIDQELQSLREQADADAELVQLGLAVAVINHEFEAAIKGVRRSLRELKPWASANKDLGLLYQKIRNNFDHLDGHLNLFTPLQRRLYRKAIEIQGSEINHYLRTLFDVRLKRHEINLETTDDFLLAKITGFPSTIYPVFVNLIDNAIFWLSGNSGEKAIKLDAESFAFLIGNNGPAISKQDYDAIFEQGFSRKPGGRGLGLFISKKALNKEGLDISASAGSNESGVIFKITWPHNNAAA